jgi:dephospho-CoA kinase
MSENNCKAIVLGITGGIACGKSEVGRILETMNFAVCDSDRVAHDLMKKGTPVYRQVVAHFGERILTNHGEISRPALGTIVFNNAAEREILNKLAHPAVREYLTEWIVTHQESGTDAAVQIPLLFESGMDNLGWDAVLCISSDERSVLKRLCDRGFNASDARERISAQMPLEEKETRADFVVPNSGTLDELDQATRKIVAVIRGER